MAFRQSDAAQSSPKRPEKRLRAGPLAPCVSRYVHRVDDHLVQKRAPCDPEAAARRIHHLNQRTVASPRHYEMRSTVGTADNRNRWESGGFIQEYVIQREQNLPGVQPELLCDHFNGVNRCSVNIRLTGFAQAAIAGADVESV